jgi:hypothetical protein
LVIGGKEIQDPLRSRRAPLSYTIQRLGIAEKGWKRAPEQQHVVLLNGGDIDPDLPSGRGQGTA